MKLFAGDYACVFFHFLVHRESAELVVDVSDGSFQLVVFVRCFDPTGDVCLDVQQLVQPTH